MMTRCSLSSGSRPGEPGAELREEGDGDHGDGHQQHDVAGGRVIDEAIGQRRAGHDEAELAAGPEQH